MKLPKPMSDSPEADALEEKADLYGKMSDDLRGQAAQIRYRLKHGNPNQPTSEALA